MGLEIRSFSSRCINDIESHTIFRENDGVFWPNTKIILIQYADFNENSKRGIFEGVHP